MTSSDEAHEAGGDATWCVLRGGSERDRLAAIARCEAQSRRRRNSLIRHELFAEPAWDMLLELYIRRHGGCSIDAADLCDATVARPTTALRWIGLLIDKGLVTWTHPGPGERDVQIALSDRGAEEMEHYLRDHLHRAELGHAAEDEAGSD